MGERRGTKGLELWCRKMTEGYAGVKVDNMTTSWRNGLAFCALIHHFRPDLIEFDKLDKADIYGNNELAFRVAEHHLGIPALLDPEDMVEYEVPDRLSILTYLSQFYQTFESQRGKSEARLTPKRPTTAPELAPATSPPTAVRIAVGRARREPCACCDFPVFLAERLTVGKRVFHRACFRCARCSAPLSLANYYETESGDYCCEVCPDELKSSVASSSLSDEQKSSLDAYSAHCDDALERPQDEELRRSSTLTPTAAARSLFFISQMEGACPEPPKKAHVVALDDLEDFDSVAAAAPKQCDTSLVTDECLVAPELSNQDGDGPGEPETSPAKPVEELQVPENVPRRELESAEELHVAVKDPRSEPDSAEELQVLDRAPRSKPESTEELHAPVKAPRSEPDLAEELHVLDKAPRSKPESPEELHAPLKAPRSEPKSTEELHAPVKAPRSEPESTEELQVLEKSPRSKPESAEELQVLEKAPRSKSESTEELQNPERAPRSEPDLAEELQLSENAPRSHPESTEELQGPKTPPSSSADPVEELQVPEPAPRGKAEPTEELQDPERASRSSSEPVEELQVSEKAPRSKTERAAGPPDYPEDLNPFGDDDADDFKPVPAARTKKKGGSAAQEGRNPFEDEEAEPDALSRLAPRAGSDGGSLWSLSSQNTIRKKKPAPPPPVTGTMRSRKTKRAPLPPAVHPRRVIAAPALTPDEFPPVDEDKSTAGRWKRLKAPSPVRPVPPKRSVPALPIPEIRRELDTIEIQQRGLENQGVRLEQIIRERCEGGEPDDRAPPDVEDLILQLFELVNEKNELFRRQAELMYLRRQQRLEEEQADVEHQIRCLMSHPDATKTDYDKVMEEALIGRLVEIVERRNQIIDCLESDRRRNIDEDTTISSQLSLYNAQREALEPKKKKKHKKLAKMLQPFRHKKDKH